MQILYGTAMAAVFMLCLVLVWTARRTLRSSPLASGELSISRLHEAIERIELSTVTGGAEVAQFDLEPEVAEINTSLLEPIALEMMPSPSSFENETMTEPVADQITEPMQAAMETPAFQYTDVNFEAADVIAEPETQDEERFTNNLAHGYNYMLEGLLLGLSVFVLIRTQRSTWRYQRSLHSSDQVA